MDDPKAQGIQDARRKIMRERRIRELVDQMRLARVRLKLGYDKPVYVDGVRYAP